MTRHRTRLAEAFESCCPVPGDGPDNIKALWSTHAERVCVIVLGSMRGREIFERMRHANEMCYGHQPDHDGPMMKEGAILKYAISQ